MKVCLLLKFLFEHTSKELVIMWFILEFQHHKLDTISHIPNKIILIKSLSYQLRK